MDAHTDARIRTHQETLLGHAGRRTGRRGGSSQHKVTRHIMRKRGRGKGRGERESRRRIRRDHTQQVPGRLSIALRPSLPRGAIRHKTAQARETPGPPRGRASQARGNRPPQQWSKQKNRDTRRRVAAVPLLTILPARVAGHDLVLGLACERGAAEGEGSQTEDGGAHDGTQAKERTPQKLRGFTSSAAFAQGNYIQHSEPRRLLRKRKGSEGGDTRLTRHASRCPAR